MRKQATRNSDLLAMQTRRQRRRELVSALLLGLAIVALSTYALAGFITPGPQYDNQEVRP